MNKKDVRRGVFLVAALVVLAGGGCGGSSGSGPTAAAYYVDAVSGSDGASGTRADQAWRSLAKVSGMTLPEGSTVYLRRGSVWHEPLIVRSSGITVDAYGSGPVPAIDGAATVEGWSDLGGGVYSLTVVFGSGEAPGNLSEDGALMVFVPWDNDATTTFAAAAPGSYSYQYASSTLFIKPASAPSGHVYRASRQLYGITATGLHDVVVRHVHVTRFSLHGIAYQDCLRCEVHDSEISEGGGATIGAGLYAGNGIEFGNSSSGGLVDGVSVHDIFDSGISPQTYAGGETLRDMVIQNAQVEACGFAGIEISVLDSGSMQASSIEGVTLDNVAVTRSGRGWSGARGGEGHGIRIHAMSGGGTIRGVEVTRSLVSDAIGDGVKLAGNLGTVVLDRLDLHDNQFGVNFSDGSATDTLVQLISSLIHHNRDQGLHYDAAFAAGLRVYQNTFVDNAGINLAVFHQAGEARLRNNAFYNSGPSPHLYVDGTLTGSAVDNNCYNDGVTMIGYAGVAYASVAGFRAGTGFEANGTGGTVGLRDPGAAAYDLTLTAASDCKALGDGAVGVTTDFSGYAFAATPSSGAYQYR